MQKGASNRYRGVPGIESACIPSLSPDPKSCCGALHSPQGTPSDCTDSSHLYVSTLSHALSFLSRRKGVCRLTNLHPLGRAPWAGITEGDLLFSSVRHFLARQLSTSCLLPLFALQTALCLTSSGRSRHCRDQQRPSVASRVRTNRDSHGARASSLISQRSFVRAGRGARGKSQGMGEREEEVVGYNIQAWDWSHDCGLLVCPSTYSQSHARVPIVRKAERKSRRQLEYCVLPAGRNIPVISVIPVRPLLSCCCLECVCGNAHSKLPKPGAR